MTYTDPSHEPHDDLKSRAQSEYGDARARLNDGIHRLRSEAAPTLLRTVTDELERRKSGISEELRGLSETLHKASREQAEKDGTMAPSGLIDYGANLIDDLSEGLEGRSVNEMGDALSTYARNNPAVFIGGCLLAGLAFGRLLTASTPSAPMPAATPASTYTPPPSPPPAPYAAPTEDTEVIVVTPEEDRNVQL